MRRACAALLLAAAAGPAFAGDFDLNVNGDAARVDWAGALGSIAPSGRGEYDLGLLHRREDDHKMTNLHLGWMVHGDAGAQGASAIGGLGVRAQYTDLEHGYDGGGFALGGDITVRVDGFERIAFRGALFYQPEVLAFGDTDSQLEWSASVGYELIRDAELYLGYREFKTELKHSSLKTIDDGAHLGLRIRF